MNINSTITIKNLNPRNEIHGDEDVLAADLKVEANLPLEEALPVFGSPVDAEAFSKIFWDSQGTALFPNETIKFSLKSEGYRVTLLESFVDEPVDGEVLFATQAADVKGFTGQCVDGNRIKMSWTIQCNPSPDQAGRLCDLINDRVFLRLEKQQAEMELDSEEAA